MLTAKMMWRRAPSSKRRNHPASPRAIEHEPNSPDSVATSNEPAFSSIALSHEDSQLTVEVATPRKQEKIERKVHINPEVAVILVPTFQEFIDDDTFLDIWSNSLELKTYAQGCGLEIKNYLKDHGLFSNKENMKKAMKVLYRQPDTHENTASNELQNADPLDSLKM